jgi:quinol monooxygenase YgiN
MKVTVLALVTAKKESINEMKQLLQSLIPLTLCEEGCINYDLHQDNENPHCFFLYENWQSEELLEKHLNSDHLLNFRKVVLQFLEIPISVTRATQLSHQ